MTIMSHLLYLSKRLDKIIVEGPYNVDWARAINQCVPHGERKRRDGIWHISARWYPLIREATKLYYIHFSDLVDDQDCPSPPMGWHDLWSVYLHSMHQETVEIEEEFPGAGARARLFVTQDAPTEVVTAAYRALIKIHHPDKGGDPDRFREIDTAYKELMHE